MRIIAGKKRGLKLNAPKCDTTRPTIDRTREDILNIITNTNLKHHLKDGQIADVFAGSGAVGLEMLSRGGAACTFYENDSKILKVLKSNCDKTGFPNITIEINAVKPKSGTPYTLIFMDAPYNKNLSQKSVNALIVVGRVDSTTLIIVQVAKDEPLPVIENFEIIKQRVMAGGQVGFFKAINA